jgi:hypothetical protein
MLSKTLRVGMRARRRGRRRRKVVAQAEAPHGEFSA